MGDPQAALAIRRHPVGIAPRLVEAEKHLLVGERTVVAHLVAVHGPPATVGMVEDAAVRAEGRPVRHDVIVVVARPAAVGVETIERAGGDLVAVILRASPDATPAVDLGVVEPVVRPVGLGVAHMRDGERLERQCREAALQPDDEIVASLAFEDPADPLRHAPARHRAVGEMKAVQRLPDDVDPEHGIARGRPHQPLAEDVPHLAPDDPMRQSLPPARHLKRGWHGPARQSSAARRDPG